MIIFYTKAVSIKIEPALNHITFNLLCMIYGKFTNQKGLQEVNDKCMLISQQKKFKFEEILICYLIHN